MICRILLAIAIAVTLGYATCGAAAEPPEKPEKPEEIKFTIKPIGWVRKADGKTTIVVNKEYEPALLRVDKLSEVWVLYWFDRNDTPEKRSILQVHPRGNPANPLTGVFATHSPVRPNLIAMTRCKIISVKGCVIEIEGIDAFPDTPVIDLKS